MIYRRANAFGHDELPEKKTNGEANGGENGENGHQNGVVTEDMGAAQCMWLARVKPEDCENIIRYTILKGKLVKPESQLRGGFDRCKGLMSW
ncbi:hypothetical protein NLG97_g6800 [Lecanicillium saksenae]|uniref:Uncharacterized protein n=1 Tax=Lecanicillium saksenae TaxID=468837 RepID=A0ACC1QNM0_9HYPO|nr:hypothetical protein NLG97_g6800 [Lecanicillium saksenae]